MKRTAKPQRRRRPRPSRTQRRSRQDAAHQLLDSIQATVRQMEEDLQRLERAWVPPPAPPPAATDRGANDATPTAAETTAPVAPAVTPPPAIPDATAAAPPVDSPVPGIPIKMSVARIRAYLNQLRKDVQQLGSVLPQRTTPTQEVPP